jgi:hypothetical protein
MFALFDLAGNFKQGYFLNEVAVPKPVVEPAVAHHVVVVDRSGSMWGVMDETKTMVEKVMVAEEFSGSELILTLISYSSKGDFTVHFSRKSVAEVLDPKSGLVKQIRGIQASCYTSVSDALNESLNFVVAGETTIADPRNSGDAQVAGSAAVKAADDAKLQRKKQNLDDLSDFLAKKYQKRA